MDVSLHIVASPDASWEQVIRPWFHAAARSAVTNQLPACVLVPERSHAQQLRARLAHAGISLLGVRFFVPAQLREFLQTDATPRVPLREHLRLLLTVAAEQCASEFEASRRIDSFQIAKAVAREPDGLLRAIDSAAAAGSSFAALTSPALAQIATQFDETLKRCGCALVAEADRVLLQTAAAVESRFSHLLVVGFNAAQWPLWPLLRAAVLSAQTATVLLRDSRYEAADLDRTWISTWEEYFGAARQVAASESESEPRFAGLLALPDSANVIAARKAEPLSHVHFMIGRDTSEQARAIVTLAIGFLSERSCDRLAILLPGPGGLARLVANWLERLGIPHNDGIAHQMRGAFDDEGWRAWTELQQHPRLEPLLRFLNHSTAARAFFAPLGQSEIRDTLKRACGDILINDVGVLREYCSRRIDNPKHAAVAAALRAIRFLPERATFTQFVKAADETFRALKWTERSAELKRLARDWSEGYSADFSREYFLRWLTEIFAESSLARDACGDHPYARLQLLRYDQAEGETWSHVILAGLNEGVWPPRDDESPFLPDDSVALINQRTTVQSRFGEGQQIAREGTTLCLGARERRAIALRQLLNVVESTSRGIGVAAELYTQSPREQAVNPSEFFARLFFSARGEALSQREITRVYEQTQQWLAKQDFVTCGDSTVVDVTQTAKAYRARRANAPFGEYEFALRDGSAPTREISLSATHLANALKRPALVWLKAFLGVEAEELNGGSWSLATGQWVHRWLAVIGAPRENRLVSRPPADEIVRQVTSASDEFRDEILSILQECGRNREPDWWRSGWRNARHIAEQFAKQLGTLCDWAELATEWELDSPCIIQLENSDELRVRGRIDLILSRAQQPRELWIVDYKTGEAKPLKSHARELHKQLAAGDGIQICVYALALQLQVAAIEVSLLTRDTDLEPQVAIDHIVAQKEIFRELARMEKTGVFGMLGEVRSEFTFTGTYPLATLGIEKDLLREKWERTHPVFAKTGGQ